MSSRFVSGGTIAGDNSATAAATTATERPPPPPPSSTSPAKPSTTQWEKEAPEKPSTEWEIVEKELEAERKRREEARKANVEGNGEQSLYDILQANKAAKQAAFEEQNRIRNQFRALDDDEIDFLDGVRDERRVEEDRVRRETEQRLADFRKAQKQTTTTTAPGPGGDEETDDAAATEEVAWAAAGRKRKREKEKDQKGVVKGVRRKTSEAGKDGDDKGTPAGKPAVAAQKRDTAETTAARAAPVTKPKPKVGLVDYGSDEEDDDD